MTDTPSQREIEAVAAFWRKVAKGAEDECWVWLGSRSAGGYGQVAWLGKTQRAHRIAYMLTNGPMAPGVVICHRCDNRPCCNPGHLFAGTHADNNADMRAKGRAKYFLIPSHVKPRGERNAFAKLTTEQVVAILNDQRGPTEIANDYKIHKTYVWQIKTGRAWKHLSQSLAAIAALDKVRNGE